METTSGPPAPVPSSAQAQGPQPSLHGVWPQDGVRSVGPQDTDMFTTSFNLEEQSKAHMGEEKQD